MVAAGEGERRGEVVSRMLSGPRVEGRVEVSITMNERGAGVELGAGVVLEGLG